MLDSINLQHYGEPCPSNGDEICNNSWEWRVNFLSLWNIQFQSWIISNDDLKKKKKNCEKQKATRMAQISFPTLNAHKNRTNCATVHQRNAKKAS